MFVLMSVKHKLTLKQCNRLRSLFTNCSHDNLFTGVKHYTTLISPSFWLFVRYKAQKVVDGRVGLG